VPPKKKRKWRLEKHLRPFEGGKKEKKTKKKHASAGKGKNSRGEEGTERIKKAASCLEKYFKRTKMKKRWGGGRKKGCVSEGENPKVARRGG